MVIFHSYVSSSEGNQFNRLQNSRSQQLSFKCSLLRRSIERGRLFGGGRKAVEEAVSSGLRVAKRVKNRAESDDSMGFYNVMSIIIMLYNI